MAPFRVLWAVPILAPPKGATKNPFGGFFGKNHFKNPNMGFFERTMKGSSKSQIGCCKEPFRVLYRTMCIHEGFFEEPLGIHIMSLVFTLRVI